MIDLHCHLLPGIDDGPAEVDESVALARAAAEQGTRVLAATPHLRHDHPEVRPAELAERTDRVRERLREAGVPLEVVQGGEVALTWAGGASDEDLRLVSYGGRGTDLLVETPYSPLPNTFEMLLEAVIGRGYRVLLAHPEANRAFQRDRERLARLVARGVLVQVTARNLTRKQRGSDAVTAARGFVRDGLAHVIASDAHSAGSFRPPRLAEAVAAAAELAGADRARWMAHDVPEAILAGAAIPGAPAVRRDGERGSRLGRIWGRRGNG